MSGLWVQRVKVENMLHVIFLNLIFVSFIFSVIFTICEDFEIDFVAMFGCVGLWNTFFLFIYSFFDLSVLMQWSTRYVMTFW